VVLSLEREIGEIKERRPEAAVRKREKY